MKASNEKIVVAVLTISVISIQYVIAQPPSGGGGGGAPIDGGLSILLGSGVVYGAKKLYKAHFNAPKEGGLQDVDGE